MARVGDFRKFGELPVSLRECSAGRLFSRFMETGDHEFVEQAGREITGTEDKVDSLVEILRPFGIKELTRTGRVAMVRGALQAGGRR